jgi:TolA-binding protein
MRSLSRHIIITLLLLPLSFAAATGARAALSPDDRATIQQVNKETADLLKSVESYSATQRDEAIQEIEIAIIRLDNRIESLQTRIDKQWDKMTQPAREQTRKSLRKLQKQRVKLAEWYGTLKGSTADAWDDIKRGFSKAYDNINNAWEKALSQFSENNS